jgi:hypothetical protein
MNQTQRVTKAILTILTATTIGLASCTKAPTTGDLVVYTTYDQAGGPISVTVGSRSGTITKYHTSGADCGASGAANFTLESGTYNYEAEDANWVWSGTITVSAGQCNTKELK